MKLERLEEDEQDIDSIWAPFAKSDALRRTDDKKNQPAPIP